MDVKYQIFVSSTFEDLQDERRAVMEAILNLRHIPVGMELFHATDENQWDYITRRIAECDYYVVIVGERYGSEVDGKSYTQKEYELAVELGIPVIGMLMHNDVRTTLPGNKIEFPKKAQIEAFRDLCKQRLVKMWKNPDDLALKVTQSLTGIFEDMPRVGWVRADPVPSIQVVEELSQLSKEKRELQTIVDKLQGSRTLQVPPDAIIRIEELKALHLKDLIYDDGGVQGEYDLLEVFLRSAKALASGCDFLTFGEILRTDFYAAGDDADMTDAVMTEFSLRKLVDARTRALGRGAATYYHLTEYGKDFVLYADQWRQNLPEPTFLQGPS